MGTSSRQWLAVRSISRFFRGLSCQRRCLTMSEQCHNGVTTSDCLYCPDNCHILGSCDSVATCQSAVSPSMTLILSIPIRSIPPSLSSSSLSTSLPATLKHLIFSLLPPHFLLPLSSALILVFCVVSFSWFPCLTCLFGPHGGPGGALRLRD